MHAAIEEFQTALLNLNHHVGSRCGLVHKYPKILNKFFEAGVFAVKQDLFAEGAQERARRFARKHALAVGADAKGIRKSVALKVERNMMAAFRCFVQVVPA